MTGEDVCKKGLALIERGDVYWWGAKGERCTQAALNRLAALYPSVYTTTYITGCKKDIRAGKHAEDCSGFVSICYGWPGLGTYTIAAREDVHIYGKRQPKNGMILWKSNHIGIYYNGVVLEARGRYYGLSRSRIFNMADWSEIMYVDGVDYSDGHGQQVVLQTTKKITAKVINDVIAGKYGNGEKRKNALKNAGFTDKQIADIQARVNKKLAGK